MPLFLFNIRSEPRSLFAEDRELSTPHIEGTNSPECNMILDEEQEDVEHYCRGGYHPVVIGDVFDERYRVVKKLGWGHFSTVWLCRDTRYVSIRINSLFLHFLTVLSHLFSRKENYVALKVVKSAQHFNETAIDEIRILKKVQDEDESDPYKNRIVSLLNHFSIRGVNGIHTCLVFEALGVSLYKLIVRNNYKGLSLPQIKVIMKQVSVM